VAENPLIHTSAHTNLLETLLDELIAAGIGRRAGVVEIGLVSNQIPRAFVDSLGYAPKIGSSHEWRAIQGG
jgi:hypothetical protein